MNTGAQANVCAGVSNGKIVLWKYLDKRWNAQKAAEPYEGPLINALGKARGKKRKYCVVEDNDPVGYKSNKAKAVKAALEITTIPMPTYSPDLNPLDFSLWNAIEARMVENAPEHVETVAAYKKRMRLTALRFSSEHVRKTVRAISKRMKAVVKAKGHNIKKD